MRASLIKWCKAEHNLKDAKFLRIGSLHDFREAEDPSLRDEAEGDAHFTVYFDVNTPISLSHLSRLAPDLFSFEGLQGSSILRRPFVANTDSLKMNFDTKSGLGRVGGSISYSVCESNAYIFCMSVGAIGECCPFPIYNSMWVLPSSKIHAFAKILRMQFERRSLAEWLRPDFLPTLGTSDFEALSLQVDYGSVVYGPRNISLTEVTETSVALIEQRIGRCEFFKPVSYCQEKEFRFVVRLVCKSHTMPLISKSEMLDAPEFANLLFDI